MITIPLRITGETWFNTHDFYEAIQQRPQDECVLIDVNSEAPSLGLFGIFKILEGYPGNNYVLTKWSNPIEHSRFPSINCSKLSHFFKLSEKYWIDEIPNNLAPHVFGLFIGRHSSARNYIMWDTHQQWGDKFLFSKMNSGHRDIWGEKLPDRAVNRDPLSDWVEGQRLQKLKDWWAQAQITSLDNKSILDQFQSPDAGAECVLSLLSHYDRFNFELVCESYTRGTTFFPTEKTIRAIMGNKPFIVYGPINYLKNLQKLGFRTFSGAWNEQYDNYEGSSRWELMQRIINMICSWDNKTRQSVLTHCASITKHNRRRLLEIINDC